MAKSSETTRAMSDFIYRGSDGCPLHASIIEPGGAMPKAAVIILLHGGGPDHRSMVPLAQMLSDRWTAVLPDIRGYGRSVCTDPSRHTWTQYTSDIASLLAHLGAARAVLVGAGIGTTIALRTSMASPESVAASVLISIEDIEDDKAKEAETALLKAFADRVRNEGLEAAWAPVLPHFPPLIGNMVRDAIPRSNPASIAAAAAIGYDRSFRDVSELSAIETPTLVIPGTDFRHPTALGEKVAATLPNGRLASVRFSSDLLSAEDFGRVFAPPIRDFLLSIETA